ncbi:hypothetical protein AAVH_42590 [Aphelenchoides avenae]|nr:hypothetical protein AAVH_42590 [Aphelenchus avenae]
MDRDQLVPVPADRCAKNCTLFSSCFKFKGYSHPHICIPLGGTDDTVYVVLVTLAVLLLAFIFGAVVYFLGGYLLKKYKKQKTGQFDFIELRRYKAVSDLTTV